MVSKILVSAVFMLSFLFGVSEVDAQGLVAMCEGTTCSACDLADLANNVIRWLIGIMFLLFAVLTVVAGFGLVTSNGNTGALQDAKKKLTNGIIGIVIVLAAWLLVDTMMRALVGDGGEITGYGPWSEIECGTQAPTDIVEGLFSDIEYDDVSVNNNTFNPSSDNLTNLGSGNTAIVEFAKRLDAKQCLYSQPKRNGCNGNPGYTDCSDLVNNAFRAAGCRSPGNTTAVMYPKATAIGQTSTLRAGDAVVYRKRNSGHVVICMDQGCRQVIHASGRGAPDNRAATTPAKDQIKISNSAYYLNQPGARVLRAADYCK